MELERLTRLADFFTQTPPAALYREYSALFWGTDGDIFIPLWASACVDGGGHLLDGTTLAVLEEYRRFGYTPVEMDGNPPDFIGQQLRFLALHRTGTEDFAARYFRPTAQAVSGGIRAHSQTPEFLAVADELDALCQAIPPAAHASRPTTSPVRTAVTLCRNNCGGKCHLRVETAEGCLLRVLPGREEGEPFDHCIRWKGCLSTYLSPRRLRYPMKRAGKRGEGKFVRISWAEAAGIITREWIRIRDAYGPLSRYVNYATGVSALIRPDRLAMRLLNADGGFLGRYGSYSAACAGYVTPYVYGDKLSGNSTEDILNTKLLLLWGHNPAETVFAPELARTIAQARAGGTQVIVIDPRRSDSAAKLADEWIPLRPSTDGALAAAMAYVICAEGLQDQAFLDRYCLGFDEAHMPQGIPPAESWRSYLFGGKDGIPKTPEWGEAITGVPADTIRSLALRYATAKPACLLPGLGNQRTGNGEQTVRALAALACLTGNVGIPGGGAAGGGQTDEHPIPAFPLGTPGRSESISCFLWSQAVENGAAMTAARDRIRGGEKLDTDVKMLFNLAGNALVNQHSDIHRTADLLGDESRCEFILCSDVFMTPSAKFADLLLPAPSFLEEENIADPWRSGHALFYAAPVLPPLFGCRGEYEWLGDVARGLGLWEEWSEGRTPARWLEHLYEALRADAPELPPYDAFKAAGGHRYQNPKPYVAYENQIRDPEGHPFATPSGKIELVSPRLAALNLPGIPPGPDYAPCAEGPEDPLRAHYPLQLIGWHTKTRCHSIYDGDPNLEAEEPHRMWMHPADASARGLSTGDVAEVFNDRGRLRIPVLVTDGILPGVVAIPQGGWYDPDGNGTDRRGSINVLTSLRPTPLARGNPQHSNLVEVRKV